MKFCGLISGGKDSIYAIQVATSIFGHTLVCGAHISPSIPASQQEEEEEEALGVELDSYMYQSVASNVVPTIGVECLGVPMVMHTTRGKTSNTRLMYDIQKNESDEEEEVEDLYTLLSYMKELFPEVTAVSCGAILSTYQRTRFEHVCSRLHLIPLAFLWRRAPQASLLQEMLQGQSNDTNHPSMQAILVKTASMGLSSRHLSRSLVDLQPHFHTLESRYGFHVCGEGGEYESLVLDCPIYRKRLILDQVQIIHADNNDDPTSPAYLKILKFHTECKSDDVDDLSKNYNNNNKIPPSIHYVVSKQQKDEEKGCNPRTTSESGDINVITQQPTSNSIATQSSNNVTACPGFHYQHGGLIQVSQLISIQLQPPSSSSCTHSSSSSISYDLAIDEFKNIIQQLNAILKEAHCTPKDVVMVHLYLSSMGLFSSINEHYVAFFGSVLPPSRVCVAVGPSLLLGGRNVAMDCTVQSQSGNFLRGLNNTTTGNTSMTVTSDAHLREVLHVQSRSCWAPSCVGPYSQANTLREGLIYIAGQIGLIPSSMEIRSRSTWEEEFQQCWKNVASVLDSLGDPATYTAGEIQGNALGGIIYISSNALSNSENRHNNKHDTLDYKANVWNTLQEISSEAIHNNAGIIPGEVDGYTLAVKRQQQQDIYEDEETRLAEEANQKSPTNDDPSTFVVPLLYVAVSELPVGARSEIELICISSKAASCLQLQSVTFSTTPSMMRPRECANTGIFSWQIGYNPTTTATTTTTKYSFAAPTVDDIENLEVTTAMRYVRGCCAVACITVRRNKKGPVQQQQQKQDSSILNLDLIVREVMNHIQKIAKVSELFVPTHLSRIRLHFSSNAACGDGTLLQSVVQSELTRLVLTRQQRAQATSGLGDQNCSIPAVSIVPVKEISNHGLFAIVVEVLDLVHMETEMWVKHMRTY